MCDFITIGLDEEKARVLQEALPRGIHSQRYQNRFVMRHLPPRFCAVAVTSGGCSCSLYGGYPPNEGKAYEEIEHRRRKYKEKGWSQAKIERAIGSPGNRQRSPDEFTGLRPDLREVLADVAEEVGELAILVHFYEGGITVEGLALGATTTISPSDLRSGTTPIVEDHIIWVRQGRRDRPVQ